MFREKYLYLEDQSCQQEPSTPTIEELETVGAVVAEINNYRRQQPLQVEASFTDLEAQQQSMQILQDHIRQFETYSGCEYNPFYSCGNFTRVTVLSAVDDGLGDGSYYDPQQRAKITATLPIQLHERFYLLETDTNKLYLFVDHTDSLAPSDDLYEFLRDNPSLDATRIVVNLFSRYMNAGSNHRQLVQAHTTKAAQYGIEFDENFPYWAGKNKLKFNPMHCYVAGIDISEESGKNLLRAAVARLYHKQENTEQDPQALLQDLWQQLDEESLPGLLRLDVSPVPDMSTTDLVYAVSQALLNNRPAQQLIPPISREKTAEFIYHAAAKFGIRYDLKRYLLPPRLTRYNDTVALSILQHYQNFGLSSPQEAADLFANASCLRQNQLEAMLQFWRMEETLQTAEARLGSADRSCVSFDSQALLKVALQQNFLANQTPFWARSPSQILTSIYPEQLLGTHTSSLFLPRITEEDLAEEPPVISYDYQRSTYHGGSAKIYRQPFWTFFFDDNLRFSPSFTRAEQVLAAMEDFQTFLQRDDIRRQLPAADQYLPHFFSGWLQNALAEKHRLLVTSGDTLRKYKLSRLLEKTRDAVTAHSVLHYRKITQALRFLAESYGFFGQTRNMFVGFSHLNYPVAQAVSTADVVLAVGNDHIPYHLAAAQVDKLQPLESLIDYGLRQTPDQNQREHIGTGLLAIWNNPDRKWECENFSYDNHAWHTWEMSKKTVALVQAFVGQEAQDIFAEFAQAEKTDNHLQQQRTRQDIGSLFVGKIRACIQDAWEAYANAPTSEEKTETLKTARDYALSLFEIFKTKNTPSGIFANEHGFDSALKLYQTLDNIIDLVESERVTPPGELLILPQCPLFLLGPNQAGKSTVLRQLGYSAVLEAQKLPQPGEALVCEDLTIDTPVGSERQFAGKSLFTAGIPGLNRIANPPVNLPDGVTFWILDELGRRTNESYGKAILITATLFASSYQEGSSLFAAATHYHNLPQYQPLFRALGLEPEFRVVEDHQHRPLKEGERVTSQAFKALAAVFPQTTLQDWPDKQDQNKLSIPPKQERLPAPTAERVFAQTKKDLLGKGEERIEYLKHLLRCSEGTAKAFDRKFLTPANPKQKQALIAEMLELPTLTEIVSILDQTTMLGETFARSEKRGLSLLAERRLLFYNVFGIDPELDADAWVKQKNKSLYQLQSRFMQVIEVLSEKIAVCHPGFIDCAKIPEGFIQDIERTSRYNLAPIHEIAALVKYCDLINKNIGLYCSAEFTDTPVVQASGAWNPQLSGETVENDIIVDFAGNKTGTIITGENHSGKSTYLRTIGLVTLEALCTGYAPARSLRINDKVVPLSLTQPVTDTLSKSSMAEEARKRIYPAVSAVDELVDHYLLTLLDEPGAPTSEEDASKLIQWLYKHYEASKNAELLTTTHCDRVPELIGEKVDYWAFKLLSDTPFKVLRGTVDSNALEVAKEFGLDPRFYGVAKIIHEIVAGKRPNPPDTATVAELNSLLQTHSPPTSIS